MPRDVTRFDARWTRGWVGLTLALGGACGLLLAPDPATEAVRRTVRDAIGPGERALTVVGDEWRRTAAWYAVYVPEWNSAGAIATAPPDAAAAAVAAAQARARRLELQVAVLQERLAAIHADSARLFTVESAVPLLRTQAVPARVIGSDRAAAVQLAERLIDAGASDGLAASDLVVQASYSGHASESPDPVIDQGANARLSPDLPVASGGLLVGRIRQAGRVTSTVQLVQDAEFRIAARLMRDTPDGPVFGASGLFAGGGREPCRLELVGGSAPVAVGDRVYTHEPFAGETVPLLIGTVTAAELSPGATQWSIRVDPACAAPPTRVEVLRIELHPGRSPGGT